MEQNAINHHARRLECITCIHLDCLALSAAVAAADLLVLLGQFMLGGGRASYL